MSETGNANFAQFISAREGEKEKEKERQRDYYCTPTHDNEPLQSHDQHTEYNLIIPSYYYYYCQLLPPSILSSPGQASDSIMSAVGVGASDKFTVLDIAKGTQFTFSIGVYVEEVLQDDDINAPLNSSLVDTDGTKWKKGIKITLAGTYTLQRAKKRPLQGDACAGQNRSNEDDSGSVVAIVCVQVI